MTDDLSSIDARELINAQRFERFDRYNMGDFDSEHYPHPLGEVIKHNPEDIGEIQERIAVQFQVLDAVTQMYSDIQSRRFEVSEETRNMILGLAEYSLLDDDGNPKNTSSALLLNLMRQNAQKVSDGQMIGPMWFRGDEVRTSDNLAQNQLAETQVAEAGFPVLFLEMHALAEEDEMFIGSEVIDKYLNMINVRLIESGIDRIPGNPIRLAFHVGKGLEKYTSRYGALIKFFNDNPEFGIEASIIVSEEGGEELRRQLDEQHEIGDQVYVESNDDERFHSMLTDQDRRPHLVHRLSDDLRLTGDENAALLGQIAKGTMAMEPPILPFTDNSHLIQVLLYHPDLEDYWKGTFGRETIERMQSIFPPSALADEFGVLRYYIAKKDQIEEKQISQKKLRKRYLKRTIRSTDQKTLSGSQGIGRIDRSTQEIVMETSEAISLLRKGHPTDKDVLSIVPIIGKKVVTERETVHTREGVIEEPNVKWRDNFWGMRLVREGAEVVGASSTGSPTTGNRTNTIIADSHQNIRSFHKTA